MEKHSFIFVSILLLVFASCSEETISREDYGTLKGIVVAAGSFTPLENVKISSSPNSSIVFTNDLGEFEIQSVKTGDYSFQAQKAGYITKFEGVTINRNNTTEIVFELSLSTSENRPPNAPVLISPQLNEVIEEIQVMLTWDATDPENDVLVYEVILMNDVNDDVQLFSDIHEKEFVVSSLMFSTKYFWQISVSDGINEPVLSPIGAFFTPELPESRYLFVRKIEDKNVIYTSDGIHSGIQLTNANANSWRPRKNNVSNKIAFIRNVGTQNHLFTMNPDGTGVFRVTQNVPIAGFNVEYLNFSWNSAGDQILYPNFDKLYKINANGSGLSQVFQTTDGKFISEIAWSNDQTKIALKVNNVSGYEAEIFIINQSGDIIHQVIQNVTGAISGLDFSVNGDKLIFGRDVSGFQDPTYRQLDTRIFQHTISTNTTVELLVEKPLGTVDLDVRYSPNEAELIFMNTSNDFLSERKIQKFSLGTQASRTTLFNTATMPDWE